MAKSHYVKCLYCGKIFDANTIPFIKPNANRYAHVDCYKAHVKPKSQDEQDYEALCDYVKKLLGKDLQPRVWKQIDDYKKQNNYTYSGILKTLKWWYEIKGNSIEKSNGGIGIVPYVYQEALKYYYNLYLATLSNENKDIKQYTEKVREFYIFSPSVQRKPPKLFDLGED